MKKLKTILGISLLFIALSINAQKTTSPESKNSINKAIKNMVKGKDLQNGKMILDAFWDDGVIFATRGPQILSVPIVQFAKLHESKKFGGHKRTYEVKNLFVNESGIATALVIAKGEGVYYEYHLGFTKKEGQWKIQTYLQHSEKL